MHYNIGQATIEALASKSNVMVVKFEHSFLQEFVYGSLYKRIVHPPAPIIWSFQVEGGPGG